MNQEQKDEIEVLKSIFEVVLINERKFIVKVGNDLLNDVEYIDGGIELDNDTKDTNGMYMLHIEFGNEYPEKDDLLFDISYQSDTEKKHYFNLFQKEKIMKDLKNKKEELRSSTMVYDLVEQLKESVQTYDLSEIIESKSDKINEQRQESKMKNLKSFLDEEIKLKICGIYSHHIYSDKKKRIIVQKAKDYNITGVYIFGKPGRVVVEGYHKNIDEYVNTIKRLKWQKIGVKFEETYSYLLKGEKKYENMSLEAIVDNLRVFKTFKHTNEDALFKNELEENNLSSIFSSLMS